MLRFYVVADYRKRSTQLGTRFAYIPLEVLPFASTPIMRYLEKSEGWLYVPRVTTPSC
jgi:ribose 5-phosphate isomerase